MRIDANVVGSLMERLGDALSKPTTICLIGSTAGILNGQPDRQTGDIDLWFPASDFDVGDLRAACEAVGIVFNPLQEVAADVIYIQVVRPGLVKIPTSFEPEKIGRFGNLSVVMPPPEVLAASKLVRGSAIDVVDVVWWTRQRGLDASDIQGAIDGISDPLAREVASENLVFVQLAMGNAWK